MSISLRKAEIRAGDAVMPGQGVFVPHGPEKAQEQRARGKNVTGAALKQLPRRRRLAGKTDNLQAPKHHPRSGAAKDSKQSEILKVNDRESSDTNSRT